MNRNFLIVQLITISRIPLAIFFSLLLLGYDLSYLVIFSCTTLIALIELTDFIDGRLARHFSVVNEFGAILDPYSDSISRIIVYWAMAKAFLVSPLVPLSMVFRDITVAYCRIILAQHHHTVSSNWSGKIKACFQGIGAFVMILGPLYWPLTGTWTITVGSSILVLVTLGSMVEYAKAAFSVLRQNVHTY